MTQEMKAMEEIHAGMIDRAKELNRWCVLSNIRMRQMESAKRKLKEMFGNNGDIGMGYVIEMLAEKYKSETGYNDRIYSEYNHLVSFINRFENDARDYGIGRDWNVHKEMQAQLEEIRKETREDEQKAFEKYCK